MTEPMRTLSSFILLAIFSAPTETPYWLAMR